MVGKSSLRFNSLTMRNNQFAASGTRNLNWFKHAKVIVLDAHKHFRGGANTPEACFHETSSRNITGTPAVCWHEGVSTNIGMNFVMKPWLKVTSDLKQMSWSWSSSRWQERWKRIPSFASGQSQISCHHLTMMIPNPSFPNQSDSCLNMLSVTEDSAVSCQRTPLFSE